MCVLLTGVQTCALPILERTGIRPTLEVNGIWGGYIGEGAKTVLPSKASAKISMRLVPNQESAKITTLFTNHFKAIAPDNVKVKVKIGRASCRERVCQ